MVDVETGDEPRPMRTLDEKPPAGPSERTGPGVGTGRAAKRPSSRPTPLRHVPKVSTEQAPRPVPSSPRVAERDGSSPTFGTDELLWLGEPSGEPGDGSTELPPWRRGLRG
jgi:hypothetical protein